MLAGCDTTRTIPSDSVSDFDVDNIQPINDGDTDDENISPVSNPDPEAQEDEEPDWWDIYDLSSNIPDDIEPDLTQTGELVLYLPQWPEPWYYRPFVELYNRVYPNVEVTVKGFGNDYTAFETSLSTELMAGTGPDILYTSIISNLDIQKLAASRVFMDLNEFIESDDSFDIDDYIKPVMDSGIINGKRYLMPYSYRITALGYVPRKLDEIGFDTTKISDPISFIEEIGRTMPKAQENEKFKYIYNGDWLLHDLLKYSGIRIVDIETKEILPDEEYFERLIKAFKLVFPNYNWHYNDWPESVAEEMQAGVTLFNYYYDPLNFVLTVGNQKKYGDYQVQTIQSINGENLISHLRSLAIREGSPNKQNAWNFVKLMLSAENQGRDLFFGIPVRSEYILPRTMKIHEDYVGRVIAPISNKEIETFLSMAINVDTSKNYNTWFYAQFIRSHLESYFNDEISYEDAVAMIKNDLRLYISE